MIWGLVILIDFLQRRFPLNWFGVRKTRVDGFRNFDLSVFPASDEETVWFHASSLGELEMLMPLIDDISAKNTGVGVSAFSDSAVSGLKKLSPQVKWVMLSPPESQWESLFLRARVKKVFLSKYDFWPGLILAAAKLNLPVVVINAEPRKSFRVVVKLFQVMMTPLPRFFLYCSNEASLGEFRKSSLPWCSLRLSVDPRYERVARRIEQLSPNARFAEWKTKIRQLGRPVGMIGSAWMSDLELLLPALLSVEDSVVIVPHDLSLGNLTAIHELIEHFELAGRCLVVDQMGLLVELYSEANWVWVGGGFERGIHSVLEPALRSVPVATGPIGFSGFPEAKELANLGRLTCCVNQLEVMEWIKTKSREKLTTFPIQEKRNAYLELVQASMKDD